MSPTDPSPHASSRGSDTPANAGAEAPPGEAQEAGVSPPGTGRHGMTVEELARQTGVSVRNIRAYQTSGLLPPPALHGRLGLYSALHKSRLELIREMRHMGFGLEAIRDQLARMPDRAGVEYSVIAQMFSNGFFRVEQPLRRSLAQLTKDWGESITPEQVMPLLNTGLYQTVEAVQDPLPPEAQVEILSPSLWTIGKQMAEMKVPLSTSLQLQNQLIEHLRAIAEGCVEQFVAAMVRELMTTLRPADEGDHDTETHSHNQDPLASLPPQALRSVHELFERLRPLAIGSVSAAFPVILQQEFDRGVHDKLQARVRRQLDKRRPEERKA